METRWVFLYFLYSGKPLKQLIADFSLERVNKAGAKFDPDKTKWFQQQYFQQLDTSALTKEFSTLLDKKGVETTLNLEVIVSLIKERAVFVADLWEQGRFFFERPEAYDQKAAKKAFKEDTPSVLLNVCEILEQQSTFDGETISREIKGWLSSKEMGFGKVMMPLRLALVGAMQGPDVFEITAVLGKKETISRIQSAIAFMNKAV